MQKAKGFLRYQVKNNNGKSTEYAYYCHAKRVNGKKKNDEIWLGRVINKEKHIFYTRKDGYFILIPGQEKNILDENDPLVAEDVSKKVKINKITNKRKTVDFGDIFIFNEFFKSVGLDKIFKFSDYLNYDTLISLIIYRILTQDGYSKAFDWWQETSAQYFFPNAKMQSQSLSEFLSQLGHEYYYKAFFSKYLSYLQDLTTKYNLLIDSASLENAIKIPVTLISDQNGIISNEIRLLVVADKISGLPIFFRNVPGDIVDISTLIHVINEIKEYNINIDRAILDAGYYSDENIKFLIDNNIPFMARLSENTEIYNLLIKKDIIVFTRQENRISYKNRTLFIKKLQKQFYNTSTILNYYVCLDTERQSIESANYFKKLTDDKTNKDLENDILKHDVFLLVSTIDLENIDVLPCYYDRQIIQRFFDNMKSTTDLITLKYHKDESLAGHILISFLASIGYLVLDNKLKKEGESLSYSLTNLSRLHCRVYDSKLLIDTPNKKVNDVAKILKIKIPNKISIIGK